MKKTTQLTEEEISAFWNAKCKINDFEEATNKEWAKDALLTLLIEGEDFSGKRPNCDSGWEYDLIVGLVEAIPRLGVIETNEWEEIEATLNEDVDINGIYYQLIQAL